MKKALETFNDAISKIVLYYRYPCEKINWCKTTWCSLYVSKCGLSSSSNPDLYNNTLWTRSFCLWFGHLNRTDIKTKKYRKLYNGSTQLTSELMNHRKIKQQQSSYLILTDRIGIILRKHNFTSAYKLHTPIDTLLKNHK